VTNSFTEIQNRQSQQVEADKKGGWLSWDGASMKIR
jgi:hypothetical protein